MQSMREAFERAQQVQFHHYPKDKKPQCDKGGVLLDRCVRGEDGRCERCGRTKEEAEAAACSRS